jgi:phage terminase large subunit GpA-like protein
LFLSFQKPEGWANMTNYLGQATELLQSSRFKLSDIKPSDWAEQNLIMGKPFPGPFKYKGRTPYTQEIIDCMAPDHPARVIAFMKGAQFGGTAGIVIPFLGWMMQNAPGNTVFTVGHESLIDPAMAKFDAMLDSTGLRKLIASSAQRVKGGKTGDTNFKKEFPFGYVLVTSADNHKIWRQVDYQYGCVDDYEAIKKASKESGDTLSMILQRFAAYADSMKLLLMSTPERDATSNIKPAFLAGDQRYYFIPCPCCGVPIVLKWQIKIDEKNNAGITWQTDSGGRIIKDSVGYICQECGDFFNDRNKTKIVDSGFWKPTAEPSQIGYYSYHASSLLAPVGMHDWYYYANMYQKANPVGQPREEHIYKAFVNLCLAETYVEPAEQLSANLLQKNIREYEAGTVPEALSRKDGNGDIILITCAVDMNGTVYNESRNFSDDARLDYEVIAWSESGASYSVIHGSVGTFIPKEGSMKVKAVRTKWTYEFNCENSVWPELDKILDADYLSDTGLKMKIMYTALDTGHFTEAYAYPYIDQRRVGIIGIKGDKEDSFTRYGVNVAKFTPMASRKKIFILKVGMYKDNLAQLMGLRWDQGNDAVQPVGFCNFPHPSGGKYEYTTYFEHYEAEEKVEQKDKSGVNMSYIWKKKTTANVQNHFFDCRLYNMACRDIFQKIVCDKMKIENTWSNFVYKIKQAYR